MKSIFFSLFFIGPALLAAQTPDSTAIKQVDSLVQVARAFAGQGSFDKAFEVSAVAEATALEKLGRESASYGNTCHLNGWLFQTTGNLAGAEKWYLEAVDIRGKVLGKENSDYAVSLKNLGYTYYFLGNYEKMEPLFLEIREIREKISGKESIDYSNSLDNLGLLYNTTGRSEEALTMYHQSQKIKEKTIGKDNPDYAGCLINLGLLYQNLGQREKAELLYLEAKEIFEVKLNDRNHRYYVNCIANLCNFYAEKANTYEKAEFYGLESVKLAINAYGKDDPGYAKKLATLENVYHQMGQYEKAEPLLLEALSIYQKKLGKENLDVALGKGNLALLYMFSGKYEKVELLYLEALAIIEKVLGKKHTYYYSILQNLAVYYQNISDTQKSEQFYLEVKSLLEENNNIENNQYAGCLINLGNLYTSIGKYTEAERLYLEARDIFEIKLKDRNHPFYSNCLQGIGICKQMLHEEKAEAFYLEVINIETNTLGEEHPYVVSTLETLGRYYLDAGQYEKAETYLLKSKTIAEKKLGKAHPNYTISLKNLGNLYERQGRFLESESLFSEQSTLEQSRLLNSSFFLSEHQLEAYTDDYQGNANNLGMCLFTRPLVAGKIKAGIMPSIAFDQSLFCKGFLLNSAVRLRNLAEGAPATKEINYRLKGYQRRLAAEYAKPIAERSDVAFLEEKAAEVEKELARSVAGYAEATRQVKWQDVQASLKAGEAAIEFVHYKVNFPKKTDSIMYGALLLLPLPVVDLSKEGGAEQPQFIPLFEAKQLEALLKPADKRKVDWVNQLYTETGNNQNGLYELLWKPLEPALAGMQTIYFSPSGQLHRLNLGAIVLPPALRGPSGTTTLGNRYRLIEVGSTRQLVTGSGQQATDSGNQAMLFGGIQYELDTTAMDQARPDLENSPVASRSRGLDFASTDSTLRGGSWKYLPWTKVEVTALDGILTKAGIKATMRKDYEASEEAFKSLGVNQPSPRILHLATHGFFFPDPKTADGKRLTVDGSEPVFKMSDHPMIRSGLLLAGGNYAWEKGKSFKPGAEDGILTAYEISQMNLSNTELVVLSACETGLGDIQGNEGVYGLQRAFKTAGAKYLIMSLWQVPDFQTQQLMSAFYRHWLQDKMSIPDAFRAAQQAMQLKFKDPFFWAGFVLVE